MKLIGEHIVLSQDALTYLKNFLNSHSYSRILVLVDKNTADFCLPMIDYPFDGIIRVPAGEEHKQLATCEYIWKQMLEFGADRHSLLINLGGGVIGDMGGFCASTYMRGIDFIQVPTTLLAMVDASVGGKLGVDFQHGKNLIGVFQEPVMNFIHVPFLKTLDERQWMSGYAEMLKHGLILSEAIWESLKEIHPRRTMLQIEESIGVKRSVVNEDPRESAYRKVLNFGHTVGHGLESLALEKDMDVLHGEAVAAGMLIEAILSAKAGLNRESIEEVKSVIHKLYPNLPFQPDHAEAIWGYMLRDKKNKRAQVHCTLLKSIGKAEVDCPISYPEFREAYLNYLNGV